jgi:hypothetical protein
LSDAVRCTKFFSTNASSSNGVLSLSASRFFHFLEILLSSLWAATPDWHTGLAAKNIVLCRQQLRLSDNFQRLRFVIRAFVFRSCPADLFTIREREDATGGQRVNEWIRQSGAYDGVIDL